MPPLSFNEVFTTSTCNQLAVFLVLIGANIVCVCVCARMYVSQTHQARTTMEHGRWGTKLELEVTRLGTLEVESDMRA